MHRVLAVQSVGHLVPQAAFAGHIHSVFEQACNIACDGVLLTLGTARLGNGPLVLRLGSESPLDLRRVFDAGALLVAGAGLARTGRVEIRWGQAGVWRPAPSQRRLDDAAIGGQLRRAHARLARQRRAHTSVIDREAAAVVAALADACRALDHEQATALAACLVGWGEGLTPAGDDFLVGLLAGLDMFQPLQGRQQRFRDVLGAAITACTPRTTAVAAQYLRLAAGGHYNEPLLALRSSLVAAEHSQGGDAALDAVLAIGASSGADTAAGLLAGLAAWLHPAPGASDGWP